MSKMTLSGTSRYSILYVKTRNIIFAIEVTNSKNNKKSENLKDLLKSHWPQHMNLLTAIG